MRLINTTKKVGAAMLLTAGFIIAAPWQAHAQEAANFSELVNQLNTLRTQIGIIQNNQVFQAQYGNNPQIISTISQIDQLAQGADSLNKLLSIPALGGAAQGGGDIGLALEGLQELASLPILQNFPGVAGISGQLNQLGNISQLGRDIQDALKNPSVQTIGNVARYLDPNTPILPGFGNLGGVFGTGGSVGNIISNPAQAIQSFAQSIPILGNLFGKSEYSQVASIGKSTAFTEGVEYLKKVPGAPQILTDFSEAIGAGSSCGASVSGAVRDLGGAYLSRLTGGAVGGAISAATGGIIKGTTPTVEQNGPLLTLISQNKNLTTIICKNLDEMRAIQRKLLEVQTELLFKEKRDDPEAQRSTVEILRKQKEAHSKTLTTRKTLNEKGEEVTKSFFRPVQEAVREGTSVVVAAGVDALKKAPGKYKFSDSMLRALEEDRKLRSSSNIEARVAAALTPVEDEDPNDPLARFITATQPQNTYYGRYFISQQLLDDLEAKREQDERDTFIAGRGVAPYNGPCSATQTLSSGKVVCIEWEVVEPGSIVADQTAAINAAEIGFLTTCNEIDPNKTCETVSTRIIQEASDKIAKKPTGITIGDIFSVLDTVCQLNPKLTMCTGKNKNIQPIYSEPIQTVSGGGTFDEGGIFADESTGANPNLGSTDLDTFTGTPGSITTGSQKPTLAVKATPVRPSDDLHYSTLAWDSNFATSCVAGNNWITYGNGTEPTASSTIVVEKGSEVGPGGSLVIYHPAVFTLSARALASFGDTDGIQPLPQTDITTKIGSSTQTTTYRPLITGVEASDRFQLRLNSVPLETENDLANSTPQTLVTELKNAKTNLSTSDSRFAEYNKVTFDGTDTLIVSAPLGHTISTSQTYQLTCSGSGGAVSETMTVAF